MLSSNNSPFNLQSPIYLFWALEEFKFLNTEQRRMTSYYQDIELSLKFLKDLKPAVGRLKP